MKAEYRYELRRYREGQKDHSFSVAYGDVAWATAIAHEYAEAEPGVTLEFWDAKTRETIAFIGPVSAEPEPPTLRSGDSGALPSVSGVHLD